MRRNIVAFGIALPLFVGACDNADEVEQPEQQNDPATTSAQSQALTSEDPADCARDADGQVSCLVSSFEVEECADAQVLGSMFRDNELNKTFEFRTAYGIDTDCLSGLEEAAKRRNFHAQDNGELVAKPRSGYRETLIIGLQISADGHVIEWERVQE